MRVGSCGVQWSWGAVMGGWAISAHNQHIHSSPCISGTGKLRHEEVMRSESAASCCLATMDLFARIFSFFILSC